VQGIIIPGPAEERQPAGQREGAGIVFPVDSQRGGRGEDGAGEAGIEIEMPDVAAGDAGLSEGAAEGLFHRP